LDSFLAKSRNKEPTQSRSKITVDAILEAVMVLLKKDESSQLSTNKIAEIAGVSIGSLYQYFDNKESILEKILLRILKENLLHFEKALNEISQEKMDLKTLIELLVRSQFDLWLKMGKVSTALLSVVPRVVSLNHFHKADELIVEFLQRKTRDYELEISPQNQEEAFYVCIQSVRAVFFMSFVGPRAHKKEIIIQELIAMLGSYLEIKR
jgi:AcrR family transcriptional regulator